MKKIVIILLAIFLNIGLFSCTPQALEDNNIVPQACCGDEGDLPPPPPPGGSGS